MADITEHKEKTGSSPPDSLERPVMDEKQKAGGLGAGDSLLVTDVEASKRTGFARAEDGATHRALKARHVQMIAIGGTIGTGLFVGSGAALATGGPIGLLLAYIAISVAVYGMMVALGELTALYPVSGAFVHYATRFVDPALGFATGWNYWYSYAITLPTEITAAAIVIQYWNSDINVGAWIAIFIPTICAFNFLGVKYYGEAEFWFSVIKVIAIIGLIILGIVLFFGGGPNHDRLGFRFWITPDDATYAEYDPTEVPAPWGPFNQLNDIEGAKGRFLAFWSAFINASFSFQGTEIVALAAGEAKNPRRNVPKAIRRVFYRILFFYIFGVLVIGLTVPYTDANLLNNTGDAASSPFVIAANIAGIPALPSIINAVILVSAFSAGNSDLYAASRTLYGLALDNKAPWFFRYCTKIGTPVWALVLTTAISALAFLNVSTGTTTVFNWFVNLSVVTCLLTWMAILISYIRFYHGLKKQGLSRDDFPYKAPFQPYFSYFSLVLFTLIVIFNGFTSFLDEFQAQNFVAAYVTLPIFAGFYLFWKILFRSKFVKLEEMDFFSGRRELDEMDAQQQELDSKPRTAGQRVWAAIF